MDLLLGAAQSSELLAPDILLAIKTALRVVHFIGLVLGLGAATLLDLIILRFVVKGQLSHDYCDIVVFSSKVIAIGLGFLWASGLGFLIYYDLFEPAKLGNEKVWAKVAIVAVLTLNGAFIHHSVLPLLRRNVGRSLFAGVSRRQFRLMLASGIVSGTSWYVPLLLGSIPQLNFSAPAWIILASYAGVLLLAIVLSQGFAHITVNVPPDRQRRPTVNTAAVAGGLHGSAGDATGMLAPLGAPADG